MSSLGPYLVGVAFWIFVGVVAVAGIVADYKRRRGNVDVIRMAIDKGQQLDPALIEKLTSGEQRDQRIDPVHMKFDWTWMARSRHCRRTRDCAWCSRIVKA